MEASKHYCIRKWSAWSPSLEELGAWTEWATSSDRILASVGTVPKVEWLPSSLRRRSSAYSKAALLVSGAVLAPDLRSKVASVFTSRHGESSNTLSILEALAKSELVSPMDFSLSVHNATSGMFTIANDNLAESSALAAGPFSVAESFTEAICLLKRTAAPVLSVIADESLPIEFRNKNQEYEPFFSCALLLEQAQSIEQDLTEVGLMFSIERVECESLGSVHMASEVEKLLKWLLTSEPELLLSGVGSCWRLSKVSRSDACNQFCPSSS